MTPPTGRPPRSWQMAVLGGQADISPCGTGIPSRGCRSIPVAWRRISARPALPAGSQAWPSASRCRYPRLDQRLLPAFTDPLSQASPAHQCRHKSGIFSPGDIPGHHVPTPDIDHQVEIQSDPSNGCGQVPFVPVPHLIHSFGPQAWNWPGLLWWPGTTAAMGLPVGVQHPI
jgi:hypothetical protein